MWAKRHALLADVRRNFVFWRPTDLCRAHSRGLCATREHSDPVVETRRNSTLLMTLEEDAARGTYLANLGPKNATFSPGACSERVRARLFG